MRMPGYQKGMLLPGRPFIHYLVVKCLFFGVVCGSIGIDTEVSLERRPYSCDKKFTEPITIALCIPLVSMCAKDPKWCVVKVYLQYNGFVNLYFLVIYFLYLPPS